MLEFNSKLLYVFINRFKVDCYKIRIIGIKTVPLGTESGSTLYTVCQLFSVYKLIVV